MMTYYEEFGIPSSATQEEIRHAHRRLIKILHPDLQKDTATRQLAEVQTRRINEISEILLDSGKREEYDANLRLATPLTPRRREWVTGLAIIAGVCMCLCFWLLQPDRPVVTAHADPIPLPPPLATSPELRGTAISRPATPSLQIRRKIPEQPERELPNTSSTESGRPEPATNLPPAPAGKPDEKAWRPEVERKPAGTAQPEEHNPLLGTWIYVPAPLAEEDSKLYRPEYIEMRIREANGLIEGQYRARYHVPDRPLSPNVGFHFAGQPGAAFHWTGSNGVAGRVELKIMSTNSLQVDWRVTEQTDAADLVSGTAILTRVRQP